MSQVQKLKETVNEMYLTSWSFCGLFQNLRGSIAASTTIGHSRVTSVVSVIRGRIL